MTLHLRIDRLVLEGTDLTSKDGTRLKMALTAELESLLLTQGLHPELANGIAVPSLPVTSMSMPTSKNPSHLGRQIAQHLAGSLAPKVRS